MATYFVGYDLGLPGRDDEGLINNLKSVGTVWHQLDSPWFVVANSPDDLRRALQRSIARIRSIAASGALTR